MISPKSLQEATVLWCNELLLSSDLVLLAEAAVAEGSSDATLIEIATLNRDEPFDMAQYFHRLAKARLVLIPIDAKVPLEALLLMASRICRHEVLPIVGASWIAANTLSTDRYQIDEALPFVSLLDDYETHVSERDEIQADIVRAAEAVMARFTA